MLQENHMAYYCETSLCECHILTYSATCFRVYGFQHVITPFEIFIMADLNQSKANNPKHHNKSDPHVSHLDILVKEQQAKLLQQIK